MSHFSMAVILDKLRPEDKTLEEVLSAKLLPWHEYECTGYKQYTEFVPQDMDEKIWEENQDKYEGNLDTFMQKYYGAEKNSKGVYGSITNPNAKWDWWSIGGRWSDYLINEKGEEGDAFQVADIDFPAMMEKSRKNRGESWDEAEADYTKRCEKEDKDEGFFDPQLSFGDALLRYDKLFEELKKDATENISLAKLISNHPEADKLRNLLGHPDMIYGIKDGTHSRQQHVDISPGFCTFGVLKDGKWYERGDMGWWGCVSDEKDKDVWEREFTKLVTELPGDKWLVIVDCHI